MSTEFQQRSWLRTFRVLIEFAVQKRKQDFPQPQHQSADDEVDTSRPSAVFTPTGGRQHTLTIALPGSVIAK
jgi:hypothetical protein